MVRPRAEAKARSTQLPHALRRARRARILCATAILVSPLASLPSHAQTAATPEQTADVTLPAVTVSATTDPATEHSGSFTTNSATIFKGVESIRDIPQPVTVITRQVMEDRGLLDLHDVLQNTPGVAVDYTDSERVTYHSRGFQIDSLQIDGLTINQSGSSFIQPDTAVLDRVEVLRGASGMLRGSGNPSATVNMVRKRPTREFQGSAGLTLGSWDRRRLEADISTPLNEAGTLRGRMVAVKDKKEFFQDAKEEDREVFYGVIEADLGRRTKLTASLQYTDLKATGAWGNLPGNFDGTPLNLPRNTYLGSDWNRWNRENHQAYTELEHRFDNDWTVKLNASYTRLKLNDFKQTYFARPNTATNPYFLTVETAEYAGDNSEQVAVGATANGPFTLLGRKHELIVGMENLRNKATASWGQGSLYRTAPLDIRNWDPYTSYPERAVDLSSVTPNKPTVTSQQGVFATTRLSITDPLSAIAGARLSWYEYESSGTSLTSNYKVTREVTPYAGLVYDFSNTISGYASYAEIFSPQAVVDANRNILEPVTGEDYEVGLKGEFFGGLLNASLGLFRITNNGKAVEDTTSITPCPPSNNTGYCRIAGGKQLSKGWELELSGEVLPNWQVMGGYTNTRTRYVLDTTTNTGQPLRSIDPKHQLRLFTTYRLGGMTQGWTVGGGVQIQSDSYVNGTLGSGASARTVTSRQGGYSVYNAMLAYQIDKHYSVQVNVNNLFDKVYYKKFAPTGISYYYGDPRNVMVSLRGTF